MGGPVSSRVTLAKILSKIRVSTARSAVFNKPHDLKMKSSKRSVPYPTPLQFFSSQQGLSEAYSNAMSKEEKRYYFYFQPKCKTSIRMTPKAVLNWTHIPERLKRRMNTVFLSAVKHLILSSFDNTKATVAHCVWLLYHNAPESRLRARASV